MASYGIGTNIKKFAHKLGRIFRKKTATGSVSKSKRLGERGYRPERKEQMLREIEGKQSRAMKWLH